MPLNDQATSTAYDLALLQTHDQNFVFAQEFGTQTTSVIGDAFQTTPAPSAPVSAVVNARLAMLDMLNSDGSSTPEPRGRTFLLPPWTEIPESPAIGPGLRVALMYARLVLGDFGNPAVANQAMLVLAPVTLIGDRPLDPFVTLGVTQSPGGPPFQSNPVQLTDWTDGSTPGVPTVSEAWGPEVYVRVFMVSDGLTFSDFSVFVSHDGIGWAGVAGAGVPWVVRRVGLGIANDARAFLDFVRWYAYPVIGSAGWYLNPRPPLTGGRLFLA